MLHEERKYSYTQSQQIGGQTGCIGYLRADMDTDGEAFFSSWNDIRKDLKTQEFKDEFDGVINNLREAGNILSNRTALSKYCLSTQESAFGSGSNEYGVRADTDKYAYIMRLNPDKGEYNLYCYCYIRKWLDEHIQEARHGIRFITPGYEELFRIPDGDMIRIQTNDGKDLDRICRYIDDYHVEVGDNLFHICEFAEYMDRAGSTVIPVRSSLPEMCYTLDPVDDEPVIIRRCQPGRFCIDISRDGSRSFRDTVDMLNKKLGVSKAQEAAMVAGSEFGWTVPAADPANYDDDGMIRSKRVRNGGDAR